MGASWNALDNSFAPLDPLTPREQDILRLIVAGLSNQEIAVQLFLTEGTVKWHNKNVFDKLDVRSRAEAIAKTHSLGLLHETFTPLAAAPKSNLPTQPTPFVGRETELDTINTRLTDPDCRLITLTGMGGIGKTRLAIQAAASAQPHFKDGVYFVPLEAITAPDKVVTAIAQSCRLVASGIGQLLDFLQRKQLLLVLDNFEHLLDAQNDLLTILHHAPQVKILITSRVPLQIREEWLVPVNGMAFPDLQTLEQLDRFDAVRLFKLCAKRAGVQLADDANASIQRICQLTQGMPLAIELAAASLRAISLQEILHHLTTDLSTLTSPLRNLPERHHSIQRVFEQSWSLLSSEDQGILRAVSIFRGGFTSAAFRDITGASLNVLVHLVDYSFVHVTGEGRYDLHPLISQILYEQLQLSGELEQVAATHAATFASFMHNQLKPLKGGNQKTAVKALLNDIKNLDSAWRWALKHANYELISKMWETWIPFTAMIGGEQQNTLMESLSLFQMSDTPLHIAQNYVIYIRIGFSDYGTYDENLPKKALQFAEHVGDQKAIAWALRMMGFHQSRLDEMSIGSTYKTRDEISTGIGWFKRSLAVFRQLGEAYYEAELLHDLAFTYSTIGKKQIAIELETERFLICQRIGAQLEMTSCLHEIASNEFFQGDFLSADAHEMQAFELSKQFDNWDMTIYTNLTAGFFSFIRGEFEQSQAYFARMLTIAEYLGGNAPHHFGMMCGFLTNTVGDYQSASASFTNGEKFAASNPVHKLFGDWGQSITNIGLRQYPSAAKYLHASLTFVHASNNIMFMSLSLPPAALILWHQGEKTRAVECMGLWFTHPATQPQWFLNSVLGKDIFDRMKADLGEPAFNQAWHAGTLRDLKTTSAELLEYFTQTIS